MSKVRTRFPKIFVGHPFKKRFPVQKFRDIFKALPFNVVYGNTDIETKHLLAILKKHIRETDYCIFDLTFWNPNVALELGMAEGLKREPGKNYYVLLDSKRSKDVPSDIKGYQRLEYSRHDFSKDTGLGNQLMLLLKKEHWPKKIAEEIRRNFTDHGKVDKVFDVSMKILGHFKSFDKLTIDNVEKLSRGNRLRQDDRDKLLNMLVRLKIIKRDRKSFSLRNKTLY